MDPLHQIVNTLSPTEKRYFTMFATAFKTDSELVQLFNVMNELPEYDEKKILDKTGIKNLQQAKGNLRKLVFKAMRNYREEPDAAQQIRDMLGDIDFLIRKGMPEEARKEIHKALKFSNKNMSYIYNGEIFMRVSLVNNLTLKYDSFVTGFEDLQGKVKTALQAQQEMYTAQLQNQRIAILARLMDYDSPETFRPFFDKHIAELKEQLALVTVESARVVFLLSLATCYQLTERKSDSLHAYGEIRKLFSGSRELIYANPTIYLSFLINYGIVIVGDTSFSKDQMLGVNEECENSFVLLKEHFRDFPARLVYFKQRLTNNKLSYCKAGKAWEMLPELELEVQNHLKGNTEKVVAALQAATLASCFYKCADYEKALKWINIYYTLDDAKALKTLMICVRILEVLIYHRNKQLDISHTKAINLYKTLTEQKFTKDYYKDLCIFLRKINQWNAADKADRKEIDKLKNAFIHLKEIKNGNFEIYQEYFDLIEVLENLDKK